MIDFQNACVFKLKQVDDTTYLKLISPMLINGETILSSYKTVRDGVVFTSKRIIAINVKGLGMKKDITSLPYRTIQAYSVETAGVFDIDSELTIWFAGLGTVVFDFTSRSNVSEICRTISQYNL